MTDVVKRYGTGGSFGGYSFDCPGCGWRHCVRVNGDNPKWSFNGDLTKPTLTPSILLRWSEGDLSKTPGDHVCHSFVRDGQIEFLTDCTHSLAGQTVSLQPISTLPEHGQ